MKVAICLYENVLPFSHPCKTVLLADASKTIKPIQDDPHQNDLCSIIPKDDKGNILRHLTKLPGVLRWCTILKFLPLLSQRGAGISQVARDKSAPLPHARSDTPTPTPDLGCIVLWGRQTPGPRCCPRALLSIGQVSQHQAG